MESPLSRYALPLVAAGAIAVGIHGGGQLPPQQRLLPGMAGEPQQTAPTGASYDVERGGVRYRIDPKADYDIQGLVVSRHDSDAWWDWIHAASNDHLNVVDLCVVWGANAAEGAYRKMSFSSGQFVCYVSTNDPGAWQPPYLRALSNNHLLTDDDRTARALRRVRVGDQVRMRGQLVQYSHNAGFAFTRGTSLTREDSGDGACETLFVHQFEVLRPAPAWPRGLVGAGCAALALALVAWFRRPHRARD